MKSTLFLAITLMALLSTAFAAPTEQFQVQSKSGDIAIHFEKGGEKVACHNPFDQKLSVLMQEDQYAFVKALCMGWINKDQVERVVAAYDKDIELGETTIQAWIELMRGINIIENSVSMDYGIEINRDFRDHLAHTMDRESMERVNGDN